MRRITTCSGVHSGRSRGCFVGPRGTDARCVIGRVDSQHALERPTHPLLAVEAAFAGDFGHRQGRVLNDYTGALDAEPFDELGRWHSTLPSKHPLEIPSAHPAALG